MHKQSGMSLFGVIMLIVVGVFAAIVGMRLTPVYIEFFTIEKTLQGVVEEANRVKISNYEMRQRFDKVLNVNSIDIVSSRDLAIEPTTGGTALSVAYSRCVPLVERLKICGDFEAKGIVKAD